MELIVIWFVVVFLGAGLGSAGPCDSPEGYIECMSRYYNSQEESGREYRDAMSYLSRSNVRATLTVVQRN